MLNAYDGVTQNGASGNLEKLKIDYEISKDQVDPVIGAYYLSLKKISLR